MFVCGVGSVLVQHTGTTGLVEMVVIGTGKGLCGLKAKGQTEEMIGMKVVSYLYFAI